MAKMWITTGERYPDFKVHGEREAREEYGIDDDELLDVPDDMAERWFQLRLLYADTQCEIEKYMIEHDYK